MAQWEQDLVLSHSPSPSNSPPVSSEPGPSSTPVATIAPKEVTPEPTGTVSAASPEEPVVLVWALLNLVISLVGVILAIMLTVFMLLWHNKKQKQNQNNDDGDEEKRKQKQQRTLFFLTAIILGIVGIVVFLLTEDMNNTRVWVDKWTMLNVAIFIIEIVAIALTFKTKKEDKKNKQRKQKKATKLMMQAFIKIQ